MILPMATNGIIGFIFGFAGGATGVGGTGVGSAGSGAAVCGTVGISILGPTVVFSSILLILQCIY
jgi:hypothetical protein